MTTNKTSYVIRSYYRGMQGQWCRARTRRADSESAGLKRLSGLDLAPGWRAQLVERSGRGDVRVVRSVQP